MTALATIILTHAQAYALTPTQQLAVLAIIPVVTAVVVAALQVWSEVRGAGKTDV